MRVDVFQEAEHRRSSGVASPFGVCCDHAPCDVIRLRQSETLCLECVFVTNMLSVSSKCSPHHFDQSTSASSFECEAAQRISEIHCHGCSELFGLDAYGSSGLAVP